MLQDTLLGRLYLAAFVGSLEIGKKAFSKHALSVHSSTDGVSWTQHWHARLPPKAFRELALEARPGALIWLGNNRSLGVMALRIPLQDAARWSEAR